VTPRGEFDHAFFTGGFGKEGGSCAVSGKAVCLSWQGEKICLRGVKKQKDRTSTCAWGRPPGLFLELERRRREQGGISRTEKGKKLLFLEPDEYLGETGGGEEEDCDNAD